MGVCGFLGLKNRDLGHRHSKRWQNSRGIVTFATVGNLIVTSIQYNTAKENAWENSVQTEKIIAAANKNAGAAMSFSTSASAISAGISDAVTKLQTQAEKMEAARVTAEEDSRRALDAAVNNSHQEQRAWVGAQSANITDPIETGKRIRFQVSFSNSGKTPARDMTSIAISSAFPTYAPFVPVYPPVFGIKSHSVVQPGAGYLIANDGHTGGLTGPEETFSLLDFEEVKMRKKIVYLYGKVEYSDVFHVQHESTFCFFLESDLKTLRNCETYNDAN